MTENENTPTPDAASEPAPEAAAETTPDAPPATETPAAAPVEAEAAPVAKEAPAAPASEPAVAVETTPARRPALPSGPGSWFWGLGRRKAAVARVRMRPGDGQFVVNRRAFDEYFTGERDRKDIMTVLEKTSMKGKVDVFVNVKGGGYTGQAGAVILGLGRAIKTYDPSLDHVLRDNNFLTRDARRVERKKYGQPGARKRFQFSKR